MEASVFTDVLGWNKWEGDESTEVITVGLHKQLQCTWNFSVIPEKLLHEIDLKDFDALAIPGALRKQAFTKMPLARNFKQLCVILMNRKSLLQQSV